MEPEYRAYDEGQSGAPKGGVYGAAEQMKKFGVENFLVSTDFGVYTLPHPVEGFREWIACLMDCGWTDEEIRTFERIRNGLDWGWWPDPWRFVRCEWQPGSRRLIIFEEHTANKMTPEETGRIVLDSLTYADEPGEEAYYHDQVVWVDDTPDGKVQTSVYRRDLGIRARPARKGRAQALLRVAGGAPGDRD